MMGREKINVHIFIITCIQTYINNNNGKNGGDILLYICIYIASSQTPNSNHFW